MRSVWIGGYFSSAMVWVGDRCSWALAGRALGLVGFLGSCIWFVVFLGIFGGVASLLICQVRATDIVYDGWLSDFSRRGVFDMSDATHADVQHYYGEVLQKSADLKTDACCSADAIPAPYRPYVAHISPEILDKFYGCGSPLPFALKGCTVLDLGCGSGRDAYLLSQIVGPEGLVIGVDMTESQLAVAREHEDEHMARFGFARSNVSFRLGLIEDLRALGIEDDSVDVVVSNCVLNLVPDKRKVFSEIFRVLKPGGELFFSDIFADRRIPQSLADDPILRGECLGGAMYTQDFRRLLLSLGCRDYRLLGNTRLHIQNPEIKGRVQGINFLNMTVRAFKLDLEDRRENYGQTAVYSGGLPESPERLVLDQQTCFERDVPTPICGNTAAMLQQTRYAAYFQVAGDRGQHYGLFDATPEPAPAKASGGCC
jgi:SAM-dependent methyltransferase